MKETSPPVAIDGSIWSLECDINSAVHGYISLFLVCTPCQALKLDPPTLKEIRVLLVHPRKAHANIKKILKV